MALETFLIQLTLLTDAIFCFTFLQFPEEQCLMQWKKHNTANLPITERSLSSQQEQECPLLNVIGASEFGVVLESERGFDIGSALTIGFHVDSRVQNGNNDRNSSFISAESIVVESHPEVTTDGSLIYRVTLMFSEIASKDRNLLVRESEGGFPSPRSSVSPRFGLN